MKKNRRSLSYLLMLPFLTGCVSMSGLQTARTLEPGKAQSTFGGGTYQSGAIISAVDGKDDSSLESLSIPFAEYSYRQGFSESWDAGFKITIIGSAVIDAKYSIVEGEKFAFATGLGLGHLSVSSGSGDNKSETTVLDFMIPLYASYDFTESLALYAVPKYILRSISGNTSGSASLAGASVGLKIGKTWGSFIEVSQYSSVQTGFSVSQANLAFFWHPEKSWLSF